METENNDTEFISFYGDVNPSKKSEMKRKVDEILDENEISEKSQGKILRFDENVTEFGDAAASEFKNAQEPGLAEVPEIKSHPSDEESFAVVPRGPESGEYCILTFLLSYMAQGCWNFGSSKILKIWCGSCHTSTLVPTDL